MNRESEIYASPWVYPRECYKLNDILLYTTYKALYKLMHVFNAIPILDTQISTKRSILSLIAYNKGRYTTDRWIRELAPWDSN